MKLLPMTPETIEFVYDCLLLLRGSANYSLAAFREYVHANSLLEHPEFRVYVAHTEEEPAGMLTTNRFSMPRYLGFGYELEEVIVHPRHQRRGVGKEMIALFIQAVSADPNTRKVIVKTDDSIAGRLYSAHFQGLSTTVYARRVNDCRND